MCRTFTSAVFVLLLGTLFAAAAEPSKEPVVRLNIPPEGPATIDVIGIDRQALAELSKQELTPERGAEILLVSIIDPKSDKNLPIALRGSYRIEDGVLRFAPRFPLVPGLRYRAMFSPAKLPGSAAKEPIVAELSLPRPVQPPAVVEQVYPSRDLLPENQLRFYLHFSAPMRQGSSYEHITLLNEAGQPIESPFLELGEELWDRSGRRLTLLIDPGRIKQGLKPREDLGPVLEKGKSYTLVIAATWRDAQGQPLKQEFRKTFRAAAPIDVGLDPKTWKLQSPAAGGREPVTVTFPWPLDHALLHRLLWVTDGKGETLSGQVTVSDHEMRWQFTPERPWRAGEYTLVIDTTLEDTAGNRVGKPFEVDVLRPVEKQIKTETVTLPFRVGEPR